MKLAVFPLTVLLSIQDQPPPAPVERPPDPARGGACDSRFVTRVPFCKACARFLEPAEILDHNFCRKCNEGKPQTQREPLERKWACTKYYYICAEHKKQEWSAVTCGECKKPCAKVTDRAEVRWKCSGCSKEYAESRCEAEECRRTGRELRAVCVRSGVFPHVPEP